MILAIGLTGAWSPQFSSAETPDSVRDPVLDCVADPQPVRACLRNAEEAERARCVLPSIATTLLPGAKRRRLSFWIELLIELQVPHNPVTIRWVLHLR